MDPFRHTNLFIALGALALAALTALVWIPLDVDTGLIEKVRRQVTIGDALGPTVAAGVIGLGGFALLVQGRSAEPVRLTVFNMGFVLLLLGLFALSFAVMRWTGPALVQIVSLLTGEELSYRSLRDTAPWKYLGFLPGCTLLIATAISFIEGRLSWRAVLTGLAASGALIALYDLPFDDLLLPPNGDV
jgi:hypothetical protein